MVSLFLVTFFLVGVMSVSAVDIGSRPIQELSFNEFEYIEELQNYSKEELMDEGMPAEEAEEISLLTTKRRCMSGRSSQRKNWRLWVIRKSRFKF